MVTSFHSSPSIRIGSLKLSRGSRNRIFSVREGYLEEGIKKGQGNVGCKQAVIISVLSLLLGVMGKPEQAYAAFGSSGAAVISQPVITPVSPQKYLELSRAKQRQRDFGVVCGIQWDKCERDVDALQEEFAEIARDFNKLEGKATEATEEIARQKEVTRGIEESLQQNAAFLDRLSRQPKWVSYAAGAAGSCVSTLVMHPLDTLKTRIMSGEKEDDNEDDNDNDNIFPITPGDLYSGVWANVIKEAPASALYLGVYEIAREYLATTSVGAQYPLLTYLLAGAMGEICGSILRAPAEAVKVIMQTGDRPMSLQEAVRTVMQPRGISNTIWFN